MGAMARKFSLNTFDSIRGPGMEPNASVAKRLRDLCDGQLVDRTENLEEPRLVVPQALESQIGCARNLLVMAFNNVTCHGWGRPGTTCVLPPTSGLEHNGVGAASTLWPDLLLALDVV